MSISVINTPTHQKIKDKHLGDGLIKENCQSKCRSLTAKILQNKS